MMVAPLMKYLRKGWCCVVCVLSFVFLSLQLNGQENWTTAQLLGLGENEIINPFQENIDFISNRSKGLPLVNQYEFRTETDEMELEQQRYQFRFEFNSRDERKAYDEVLTAQNERYSWLQSRYNLEQIEDRYQQVVDLIFLRKNQELTLRELILLRDKQTVLKKMIENSTELDVEQWIKNEESIFEAKEDSISNRLMRKRIISSLTGNAEATIVWGSIIETSSIISVVDEIFAKASQSLKTELTLSEEKLANAEFKLELAEGKKWLDFAQIQYQANDKLSFQNELSIGTSIRLPSSANNRMKKNEAALEVMEARYKTKMAKRENEESIGVLKLKLSSLFEKQATINKLIQQQKLEPTFEAFDQRGVGSPLFLLDLKRAMLKNENKMLNIEEDIFETYLDILSQSSAYLNEPMRNFLSGIQD